MAKIVPSERLRRELDECAAARQGRRGSARRHRWRESPACPAAAGGTAAPRHSNYALRRVQGVEVKAQDREDSFRRHQVGPYSCMHGEPVDECV
jgi:hypothetical protein